MSSVKINIPKSSEPSVKKERKASSRIKHSLFFITINTNKRFTELTEECQNLANKLSTIANDLFDNPINVRELIISKDKTPNEIEEAIVEIGSFDGEIELGSESHNLHLHGVLPISSRIPILLNLTKIRERLYEEFKYKLHLDVFKIADSSKTLLEYAKKNPAKFAKMKPL